MIFSSKKNNAGRCLACLLFLLQLTLVARADQSVRIQTVAPPTTIISDDIRLQFVINTLNTKKIDIEKSNHFNVLIGPKKSEKRSPESNRNKSKDEALTITYILQPKQAGHFPLPRVTIEVEGKTYQSSTQYIKILPANKENQPSKDLFILSSVNRTSAYEQEPIVLTYKVYRQIKLNNLHEKVPDIKDFLIQEIDLPVQKSFQFEHYNGINYQSTVWSQYVIYPQQSGKLEIPNVKFEGIIARQKPNSDPMEEYFNGNKNFATEKVTLFAPSVTIDVKKLPDAPSNYIGAVGKFTLKSSGKNINGKTGHPFAYQIIISGKGNFKMIKSPVLDIPKTFDVSEPQLSDSLRITQEGEVGYRKYTYEITPKAIGEYVFPSNTYTYFDTEKKKYLQIKTKEIHVSVTKGNDDSKQENAESDIHNVKETLFKQAEKGGLPYIILAYLLTLGIAMFVYSRMNGQKKTGKNNLSDRLIRKEIEAIERMVVSGKCHEGYNAIYSLIDKYLSIRLKQEDPLSNTEEIKRKLTEQGVSDEHIVSLNAILSQCQMAKYANIQDEAGTAIRQTLNATVSLLNNLDQTYPHTK